MSLPFYKPLYFRIRHIEVAEDPQEPQRRRPPEYYWLPPVRRDRFAPRPSYTSWFLWNPGADGPSSIYQCPPGVQNFLTPYKCSSMFWSTERHCYLHLPFDCTSQNAVEGTSDDWCRLSFRTVPGGTQYVSVVGRGLESDKLCFRGPDRWFEELLPVTYQTLLVEGQTRPCQLAGDLSMLLGFAAFSTIPDYSVHAIRDSFRPVLNSTEWRSHSLPNPESMILGTSNQVENHPD